MNSLNDTVTRARIREVNKAHDKTFHWLFDPQIVSFTGWLRDTDVSKSPIYWIQGKPGSGKSTLMKFAMHDVRISKLLNGDSGDTWTLAAFFFHDRGSEMQKTLVGMLQEVLRSVLDQVPALLPYVIPSYINLVREQRTRNPIWDLDRLILTFGSVFEQREVHVRILFLLDALDEHYGDKEILISLIKDLTEKTDDDYVVTKWCLASRSWTVFERHFDKYPGFSIHDYTQQDIRTYVESQLNFGSHGRQPSLDQGRLAAIIDTVTRKALGVFIWVRLVVDRIAKGLRDGTPYAMLETQVEEMPQELNELYADTLRRVEPEYATEAYIMLQMAFCSLRSLPLESFMASLDYNYHSLRNPPLSLYSLDVEQSYSSPPYEDRRHQMRRIASRSGGLLETVSSVAEDEEENNTSTLLVQFIHQTVKEYVHLQQDHLGLVGVLHQALQENGNSFLLRSCQLYDDERVLCIKKDMFVYAKLAEDTMATVTTVISWPPGDKPRRVQVTSTIIEKVIHSWGSFDIVWWAREQERPFYDKLQRVLLTEDYFICVGLAVAANLLLFINDAYLKDSDLWDLNPSLLCIAAAGPDINTGSRKVDVDRMIRQLAVKMPDSINGGKADSALIMKWLSPAFDTAFIGGKTYLEVPATQPLPWMLVASHIFSDRNECTRLSVARTLLQLGANANATVSAPTFPGPSLIEHCVRYESADLVRLLLEFGAVPTSEYLPWPLLRFARIRQDGEVLQALSDFGFDDTSQLNGIRQAPFEGLLMAGGLMLAAPSGGVPAALALSYWK